MATTDISLCSRALILLGAGTISSFTEETDRATICANAYPGLKESLLSRYPWRFLMTKKALTRDASAPIGEWSYSYVIPGEALTGAPHAVFYGAAGKLAANDYEIFGRRLYTDERTVLIDFVEAKAEANWPAYFQTLVVYALCAEIAFAVTDQNGVAQDWQVKAFGTPGEGGEGGYYATAKAIDAQSSGNIGIRNDAFVDARFGTNYGAAYDWADD